MGITIGDYVTHKKNDWHGKMKVKSINFGTVELELDNGNIQYYNIIDLIKYNDTSWKDGYWINHVKKEDDPLYCNCVYPDAKIVESSIQVQGSVEAKDKFKYCRNCKKERK
jgi:hypothetical protein